MLMKAILDDDTPEVRAKLEEKVEGALDTDKLRLLMNRNALCEQVMSEEQLFRVKDEKSDVAEARKLQPYFIRAFFKEAFEHLGGDLKPREPGRFEITWIPSIVRERDRQLSGRDRVNRNPVVKSYERICFEKKDIYVHGKPIATMISPGHPLMQSVVDLVQEQHRRRMKRGSSLSIQMIRLKLHEFFFLIDHAVRDGNDPDGKRALSRRIQFVEITPDGTATNAGWGPHLDYEPLAEKIGNSSMMF